MNRIQLACLGLFFLLFACKNEPENLDKWLVSSSQFTLKPDILKDGDYVDILGATDKLTKDHKIDFYNLVVVRSVTTGDTINVLVTNLFEADKYSRRTRFISNSTEIGILAEKGSAVKSMSVKEFDNLQPKSYKKVLFDRDFIAPDVRKFPAITGNLGDFEYTESELK